MSNAVQDLDKPQKKRWYQRLRDRYRLVIRDDETYEVKLSFRLSRLNVFMAIGSLAIFLIVLTIFIIAFTPLREYIPGYKDVNLSKNVYELHMRTDSLEYILSVNERYINNLQLILDGKEPNDELITSKSYASMVFFTPLKGMVTNEFNPVENHYGIDIVAPENEVVKATMDGIVLFASWTIETGHVIVIQHQQNYISVYKHNAVLLKQEGAYIRAGEPIAIVGESGLFSTGPHLHFELWHNGNPVNPRDYIVF